MLGGFFYHLKESLKGLSQNRLVNIAALLLLIACLLVTGAFGLLVLNINSMVEELGDANEITVFLDEDSGRSDAEIGAEILAIPGVENCKYISASEGLESLRDEFGSLLDGLEDDNPIRASYRITVSDQNMLMDVAAKLAGIQGIAKVNYRDDIAKRFLEVRNVTALVGAVFMVGLGMLSIFIISNSVRISAFTRRHEISIMKTVGATNRFIRSSFMLEGLIIGIAGALTAYIVLLLIYEKILMPALSGLNFITPIASRSIFFLIALAFGAAGPLLGIGGSALALRRYLK